MLNKRLLIFSNQALSKANSNGRTLLNFFSGFDKSNLAQFYLQSDEPDFNVCENYFFVSDGAVLKSVLKRRTAGKVIEKTELQEKSIVQSTKTSRKTVRNPLTMLIRNFLWNRKCWRKDFYKWVEEFKPEAVLFQAGDAPFLYNMSVEIAQKYNIPLVIYNSEDYYFKDYNYFRNSGITGVFYPLFRSILRKSVKKALEFASISIYISEDLKNTYDEEFNKNSVAIYTATEVEPNIIENKKPVFSYLGNLGVDRHTGLIKIAKALNKINPEYRLDVYGKIPNDNVDRAFENCSALNYCGLVSYERVKEVNAESLLVFHTESDNPFFVKDIRHGFTTKIADSLASGTCFCIFAPETLSCTKYIKENNCGCVITDEALLEEKLREIISNEGLRQEYINNALEVVNKNHNLQKNQAKFEKIINNL